jgi:hypothetical protein
VFTTSGTHTWSFGPHIFHNGQPSHGGDRTAFEMMTSTGTKATEIHSHHCLYCDITFPQFDDLIKNSRENHPYHCYYCKTTFVLFEEIIKQSTENHGSLMLKVKYLELNSSSGHYGYKSHNFNDIPEKIKALVPVCS